MSSNKFSSVSIALATSSTVKTFPSLRFPVFRSFKSALALKWGCPSHETPYAEATAFVGSSQLLNDNDNELERGMIQRRRVRDKSRNQRRRGPLTKPF